MKIQAYSLVAVAALAIGAANVSAEDKAVCTDAEKTCCAEGAEKACCTDKQAKLTKVQYEVKDMSCAACEDKVSKSLASVAGVGEASACSKEKYVKVAYDSSKVKDKDLMAAIKKAGFTVSSETVEVGVEGMHCGGCSGKVSEALAKIKGVQKQDVCHESGKAVVKFDPSQTSQEKVLAAINGTGFKALQ
ncbi:MAG: heavy-metal-associated domain-containing protein [Limisphaerales bacterium]|jgi:Cu+-exporting ATPase